ncbi:MAG: hypothetical protein LBT80_07430 [Lactobacillaceae bacterium]|jgi:hypothetical protein|nr:hypothetical protein [Lactobacillaceae bacterium]
MFKKVAMLAVTAMAGFSFIGTPLVSASTMYIRVAFDEKNNVITVSSMDNAMRFLETPTLVTEEEQAPGVVTTESILYSRLEHTRVGKKIAGWSTDKGTYVVQYSFDDMSIVKFRTKDNTSITKVYLDDAYIGTTDNYKFTPNFRVDSNFTGEWDN